MPAASGHAIATCRLQHLTRCPCPPASPPSLRELLPLPQQVCLIGHHELRFLLPQGVSKDLIIVLLTLAASVLGFALAFVFNLALYVQGTVDLGSVSAIWHQRDTLSTITSNAMYNLASNMVLSEAAAVSTAC
ncbi:hypothetical protein Rsub_06897 [Raphidocelis subcapitata]|uniref:Uncharacterized protein n=1 Tax=Raphidocelis subcapitata TaxID=307507 RepID=A0A2V0P1Z3_9CHLO|nr:hypothetical protein Rsub_06897 [Raphidocelis subcapitata]|eukprot:GBF93898.1 hypothetical protein Rsub_06897 [Raphidocelis subcapitata]